MPQRRGNEGHAKTGPRAMHEDGAMRGERRWASKKGPQGVHEDGAMRGMLEDGATRDARRWSHGGHEKTGHEGYTKAKV